MLSATNPTKQPSKLLSKAQVAELKRKNLSSLASLPKSGAIAYDFDDSVGDISADGQAPIKGGELLLMIMQFAEIRGIPQVITTHRTEGLDQGLDSNGLVSTTDINRFLAGHGIHLRAIFRRYDIVTTESSPEHLNSQYDPIAVLVSDANNEKFYQQAQVARVGDPQKPLSNEQVTVFDDSASVVAAAKAMGYDTVLVPYKKPFVDSKRSDYGYLFELAKRVGLHDYAQALEGDSKANRKAPEELRALARHYWALYQEFEKTKKDVVTVEAQNENDTYRYQPSDLSFEDVLVHPGIGTLLEDVTSNPEKAQRTLQAYYSFKTQQVRNNTRATERQANEMRGKIVESLIKDISLILQGWCSVPAIMDEVLAVIDAVREHEDNEDLDSIQKARNNALANPGKLIEILSKLAGRTQSARSVLEFQQVCAKLIENYESHISPTQLSAISRCLSLAAESRAVEVPTLGPQEFKDRTVEEMQCLFSYLNQPLLIQAIDAGHYLFARDLVSRFKFNPLMTVKTEADKPRGALASILYHNHLERVNANEFILFISMVKRMNELLEDGRDPLAVFAHFGHEVTPGYNVISYLNQLNEALKTSLLDNLTFVHLPKLPDGSKKTIYQALEEALSSAEPDAANAKQILKDFYTAKVDHFRDKGLANPELAAKKAMQAILSCRMTSKSLLVSAMHSQDSELVIRLLETYKVSPIEIVMEVDYTAPNHYREESALGALLKTRDDRMIMPVLGVLAERMHECLRDRTAQTSDIINLLNQKLEGNQRVFDVLAAKPEYLLEFFTKLPLNEHPDIVRAVGTAFGNVITGALESSQAKGSRRAVLTDSKFAPGSGSRREKKDQIKVGQRQVVIAGLMVLGDAVSMDLLEQCVNAEKPNSRNSSRSPGRSSKRSPDRSGAMSSSSNVLSNEGRKLDAALKQLERFLAANTSDLDEHKRLNMMYKLMRENQDYKPNPTSLELEAIFATVSRLLNSLETANANNLTSYSIALQSIKSKWFELEAKPASEFPEKLKVRDRAHSMADADVMGSSSSLLVPSPRKKGSSSELSDKDSSSERGTGKEKETKFGKKKKIKQAAPKHGGLFSGRKDQDPNGKGRKVVRTRKRSSTHDNILHHKGSQTESTCSDVPTDPGSSRSPSPTRE